jgi:hypothetical protein
MSTPFRPLAPRLHSLLAVLALAGPAGCAADDVAGDALPSASVSHRPTM